MPARIDRIRHCRTLRLAFERLEPRLPLSAMTFPVDPAGIRITNSAQVTVTNPDAIADGCPVAVGDSLTLFPQSTGAIAPLVAAGDSSASDIQVNGGEFDYSSDAVPQGATGVNDAQVVCTDPSGDLHNAWRSTATDSTSAGTIPMSDGADGTPVSRTTGPMTTYLNRYGQAIASSQDYTDTYADGSTSSGTGMTATQHSTGNALSNFGGDDVTAVTPSPTQLSVTSSDEGTVDNRQLDDYGNVTQAQVTTNGLPQFAIDDDGTDTAYTFTSNAGTDVYTVPDGIGFGSAVADGELAATPAILPPGLSGATPVYTASHGLWPNTQWANYWTDNPSGYYSQPPGQGDGFDKMNADGSFRSCVYLYGVNDGHCCCNNLVASTVTDSSGAMAAGSVDVDIDNALPLCDYRVTVVVTATVSVSVANIGGPILTNPGSPAADAEIKYQDGSGNDIVGIRCSGPKTIPNGISKSVTGGGPGSPGEQTVTVSTNVDGWAHVCFVKFDLGDHGCGMVSATADVKVTSIVYLTGAYPQTQTNDSSANDIDSTTSQTSSSTSGRPLLWQYIAAGRAVLNALEDTIDPENVGAHSKTMEIQTCNTLMTITLASMANNGGTRLNATADQIQSAIAQVLESNGMTIAPASSTPNAVQTEAAAAAADVPADTTNTFLFFDLVFLDYFADNTITFSS